MEHPGPAKEMNPQKLALRLSLAYAIIGTLWILFSDRVLVNLGLPLEVERAFNSVKGGAYVVVTSGALYVLALRMFRSLSVARAADQRRELGIRQAYVDVIAAVTGGKLVLVTDDELRRASGTPLSQRRRISQPDELSAARSFIQKTAGGMLGDDDAYSASLASGEALTNALVHGGWAEYQLLLDERNLQVLVRDEGPGIDFKTLPNATLLPGFSTAESLGMGFTIMLNTSEKAYVATSERGTSVLLEFA